MKPTLILAALVSTLPATVATAEPKAPPPATTEMTAPAAPAQRYCVKEELPGSRIIRRECRTVAQWNARDVDILALAKR